MFGEKYGDRVRVVTIPGFSVELCGGTHARATGDIGLFTITQESGVAAGVRRIEALTGDGALHDYQTRRETLQKLVTALGVGDEQAAEAAARLQQDARRLAREVQELKVKLAMGGGASAPGGGETGEVDLGGRQGRVPRVPGLDKNALREFSDSLEDRHQVRRRRPRVGHRRRQGRDRGVGDAGPEGPAPRRQHRQGAGARSSVAAGAAGRTLPRPEARTPRRSTPCWPRAALVIEKMVWGQARTGTTFHGPGPRPSSASSWH